MSYYSPISLYDRQGNRKYLNASERLLFHKAVLKLNDEHKVLFLLLLFWTGVRISEALSLKRENIDLEDQALVVKCLKKRNKVIYRRIPIPPSSIIRAKWIFKLKNESNSLFPWSRRTGSRYIDAVINKCGIHGSKACAKGLRHSFAVHCVTKNVPISLLSTWLGHSHLSTTTIYLNIIGTEEREFAERIWTK